MLRKALILLLTSMLTICMAMPGLAGEKSSWRVDGKLIREGDPQYEVRSIAGRPDHRDVQIIEEEFGSDEHVDTIWTYESENKDKVHRVFFRDDVVQKIVWERI